MNKNEVLTAYYIGEVCKVYGISKTDMFNYRKYAELRHVVMYLLSKYHEITHEEIGVLINSSRENVTASILTIKGLLDVDKTFIEKISKIVIAQETFKKAYIAGKVTGLSAEDVRAKFDKTVDNLITIGYIPIDPTTLVEHDAPWHKAMRKCVGTMLLHADIVYMQSDWKESKGARRERMIARLFLIPIVYA